MLLGQEPGRSLPLLTERQHQDLPRRIVSPKKKLEIFHGVAAMASSSARVSLISGRRGSKRRWQRASPCGRLMLYHFVRLLCNYLPSFRREARSLVSGKETQGQWRMGSNKFEVRPRQSL